MLVEAYGRQSAKVATAVKLLETFLAKVDVTRYFQCHFIQFCSIFAVGVQCSFSAQCIVYIKLVPKTVYLSVFFNSNQVMFKILCTLNQVQ